MNRRRLLMTAGSITSIGVAGCTTLTGGRESFDIGMSANAFLPDSLTIDVGDTVVWMNDGSRAHTVTAYEHAIPEEAAFFATGGYSTEETARDAWHREEGGNLYSGERFEHTFDVAGIHPYFCVPHESHGMIGEIVVEA